MWVTRLRGPTPVEASRRQDIDPKPDAPQGGSDGPGFSHALAAQPAGFVGDIALPATPVLVGEIRVCPGFPKSAAPASRRQTSRIGVITK